MRPHISSVERAFQVARSGEVKDMQNLRRVLKQEGYGMGQFDGMPALSRQLRTIMAAADAHAEVGTANEGEVAMANVFIEARPKGREGAPIEDYVVEEEGGKVLKVEKTQHGAIAWAKANDHTAHVARVRTTQRGNPDHWRRA